MLGNQKWNVELALIEAGNLVDYMMHHPAHKACEEMSLV